MTVSPQDMRRVIAFRNATDADLHEILEHATLRAIEEGGYFFLQGDAADYAYVLVSGQVKLLQGNALGQSVNLRTIYPWQLFGALGIVRSEPDYPASAQALEDSTALAMRSELLKDMFKTRPYLSMDLMQLMTGYIQEMQTRYRELATERVERRIGRVLLRLAAQSGQKAEDGIQLVFSRQDLAEMSGSTLHTVSRVLAEWDRRGLVEAGREHVKILDPHGLVRLVDEIP